ncbi:MAG TPA: patatin-like phospholipase family protein [Dinghuibacter sp.]|uniref:patatin-like phospholipase family protein n=1 Tax=Dinghuibacter sp. TaxID=2024697 RepID=UPI002BC72051|nr:patatin-like phospholipase family protein [Dinghuibacter sp.]HTJ10629.1 patatin-like phospholipase family protein [Dinghuibacter sp.]
MMQMARLGVVLCMCCTSAVAQRPKIGVTLSGGGAKGLAHIGILKAIDSAGLKVDAITGTSMGAIFGGLYAAGYSADTLEKITRAIDWGNLLSNQTNLTNLKMEEKDEYGKYALELPWSNHSFRLPTGLLEAEELWLKFSELFFPVYRTKDFTKLSIPFRCIATNISDGSIVVLDKGELVKAIRSSMAIPTVFTAVSIDSVMLVDGGVVRNFPVREVRDLGANIVIGSSVANGLLPTKKINNVLQVLLQIAFFKEAEDNKEQQKLTDVYIFHPLEGYSATSFGRAGDIVDQGLSRGRDFYPVIKRLKDSLDRLYGPEPDPLDRLPPVDSVQIDDVKIKGLVKTDSTFFVDILGYKGPGRYTARQVTLMARRVYGTRYYEKVFYYLEPWPDGSATLVFEVSENPTTEAKLGLSYNIFSGAALVANFTTRNYFTRHSRSLVTASIGQTFRIRGQHLQYFGLHNQTAMILTAQYESPEYNTYTDFQKDGLYRYFYTVGDLRIQRSVNRIVDLGLGTRFENNGFRPLLLSPLEVRGTDNSFTSYPYFQLNTLDRWDYPRSGFKINAEYDVVYGQSPDFQITENGLPIDADSLNKDASDYTRFLLDAQEYAGLSRKSTLLWQVQAGMNFRYQVNRVNDFIVGGLTPQYHNQITFAGLSEGTINTSSIATALLGYRYELLPLVYVTAKENIGIYNFLNVRDRLVNPAFLSGSSLSLGYDSPIGPIEFSLMYGDQSHIVLGYVNIGVNF